MNLVFDGVSASYKKDTVLENIRFSAESGSITALTGRNGAGKSTLINCLFGEKRDYRGKILLDEQDVRTMSHHELATLAACLPQILPRPHVTVRELVSFGRTPYTPLSGKLSPVDQEMIDQAIRSVNMERFADAYVDNLSGGERKKAFFAMTLAQDTPVLVLDEPTSHLDTVSRFAFLDLIEKMCRRTGKTFLIVMHDLPEVLRYADRIVTIENGKVLFDGTPAQCLAEKIPQNCFRIEISGDRDHGYAVSPVK